MVLQIFALCISISALALAAFTYFKHDAKLKKQSALLNKFQLEKITKEKDDEKKQKLKQIFYKKLKERELLRFITKVKLQQETLQFTFQI
ncbi:hypothetical protein OWR28_17385 [Chryseobacterium sp. 1B4]